MTTQRKIEIVVAGVVLLLAAIFLHGWILERQARNEAEKAAAVDEVRVQSAEKAIAQRDADASSTRKQIDAQIRTVTTPAVAAKIITRYLPSPSAQPVPTVEKAELPPAVQAKLPDAPSYAIVTDMQAEDIARNDLACDAHRKELQACKADVADLRTEVAAKTDESRHWEAAAKGGTKWQRFGRVMKFVACAGGGAAVGQAIDHSARGAAIGGATAVAGCSFLKP